VAGTQKHLQNGQCCHVFLITYVHTRPYCRESRAHMIGCVVPTVTFTDVRFLVQKRLVERAEPVPCAVWGTKHSEQQSLHTTPSSVPHFCHFYGCRALESNFRIYRLSRPLPFGEEESCGETPSQSSAPKPLAHLRQSPCCPRRLRWYVPGPFRLRCYEERRALFFVVLNPALSPSPRRSCPPCHGNGR